MAGMSPLLNLPNELLISILELLPIEDILEVRATCTRLYEFCNERFMNDTVLYFNYCKFPSEIISIFSSFCIPRKIRFGEQIDFEKGHEEFLEDFGKKISMVSFCQCKNLDDEIFLYLLQFFPNLEELEIKAHFLSVDEIFGRNTQLVTDDNKETLRGIFKKLKKFSTECCYVSPQQFNDLVGLMPQLEGVKVSYISTFESCLTPKTISAFVRSHVMQLQYLECGDSASDGIDDRFFKELSEMTDLQLKKFTFSMKSVGEQALKMFLNTQTNLEILEVYHSWKMSNEIVEYIGQNLLNLKVIALKNGVPRLRGLSFIRELKQLQELHLIDNRDVMSTFKFNDDYHVAFGIEEAFPALKKLSLDNMIRSICPECWIKLTKYFHNLKYLSLYKNKIDDNCLPIIFKCLTNLEELYLNRCNLITDVGMLDVREDKNESFPISNLKFLRILQIKRCTKITERTFIEMGSLLNLKELDLSESNIEDIGVEQLVVKCPRLERLTLNELTHFNSKCLEVICKSLPKLKVLNISRAKQLLVWSNISQNCKYLQVLIAEGCSMTCKDIYEMFEKVTSLQYLKCTTLGIRRFEHRRDEIFYGYD